MTDPSTYRHRATCGCGWTYANTDPDVLLDVFNQHVAYRCPLMRQTPKRLGWFARLRRALSGGQYQRARHGSTQIQIGGRDDR